MPENRHGLSREVPPAVKRQVRRRCGYGCVICGRAIVQYHHFDPPFADAREHNPDGITLLCGSCHDKENRGLLSDHIVRRLNANPVCLKKGFAFDDLLFSLQVPYAELGEGTLALRCQFPILYDHEVILAFDAPEEVGGPVRLNARFHDDENGTLLHIQDNEWRTRADHVDVKTVANRLVIRDKTGIVLELHHSAIAGPRIVRLRLTYKGYRVEARKDALEVRGPPPKFRKLNVSRSTIVNEVGICLTSMGWACLSGSRPAFPDQVEGFAPVTHADFALVALHRAFLEPWEAANCLSAVQLFGLFNLLENCPLSVRQEGGPAFIPLFTACHRALEFISGREDRISVIAVGLDVVVRGIPPDLGIVVNPFTRFTFTFLPTECRRLREAASQQVLIEPQDRLIVELNKEIIDSLRLTAHPAAGQR